MTTIFNTVEVSTGRVNRIINFLQSSPEFFIAIGKNTPWDSSYGFNISDTNPPFPLENSKEILEPIIYKRIRIGVGSTNIISAASNKAQCLQNDNTSILSSTNLVEQSPATENFTFYALEDLINSQGDAYINNPEFIYIQGEITDLDYNSTNWRCSALYTKLFLNTGVPTNLNIYTPDQVKGGFLHHLTYNSPVLRQPGKIHSFEYIINV
jgi:hypothetical protein